MARHMSLLLLFFLGYPLSKRPASQVRVVTTPASKLPVIVHPSQEPAVTASTPTPTIVLSPPPTAAPDFGRWFW